MTPRVLLLDHTSLVSGAQHALIELARALPPDAVAGALVPSGDLAERLAALGIATRSYRGMSGTFRLHPRHTPVALGELAAGARAVRRAARALGADLVHANSVRAGLVAVTATRLGGPPALVHLHDVLPERPDTRLIAAYLRRGAGLVAISHRVAEAFGAPDAPVLHNPIDLRRFSPAPDAERVAARLELGVDPQDEAIGLVGQITKWKGHDTAIAALHLLRDERPYARLLIVGDTVFAEPGTRYDNRRFRAELDEQIGRLGLADRVTFLGARDDVPRVLAALDALVMPSWEEPLGRSALEAMAMAVPVVATNRGGLAELARDGEVELVPPRDPERLAEGISAALRRPRTDATRARRLVAPLASERYAERVLALYRALAPRAQTR